VQFPGWFSLWRVWEQYPSDTGRGWSVKSWYVTLDGSSFASSEVLVAAGDTIFGNMTRIGANSFFIGARVLCFVRG
jgi:hypothetical protein